MKGAARCAIRDVPRGSLAKPRMAREEIHATLTQGSTPLRKPPRLAGGRWHPRRPPERQYSGRCSCGFRPHETRVAEERREVRRRDETEKSQASARPEAPRRTQMSAGRRPPPEGEWESGARSGPTQVPPGSGGLGGSRRPGFSNSREMEVNSATAEQTVSRIAL